MGCDPRECHASTRLTLSINVRLLYTRFCATAINTVTSQVRSISVGLHTHSHAENITGVNSNSVFGSELSTFCTEHNYVLSEVDRLGCGSGSFTYLSEAHGTTSWIDHCVCTEQAHPSITDVNICYDMQSSDHFPISICIDVNSVPRLDCAYIPPQSRLNWSKASADNRSTYRDKCAELLGNIELPHNAVCFSNTSCKDVSHIEGTKDLYCCIVNALHTAALNVIPVTRASGSADDHNIPGWNDIIKAAHPDARDAFKFWVRSSKPRHGEVFDSMRISRATCCVNVDERRLLFELIFLPSI